MLDIVHIGWICCVPDTAFDSGTDGRTAGGGLRKMAEEHGVEVSS